MVDDQARGKTPTVIADHVDITYRVFGVRGDRHPETEDQSAVGRLVRRDKVGGVREVAAVKDVSFVAYHGESIGIIGRNGSGKSTLLRAIAGLIPATKGRVWVNGQASLLGVNAVLMRKLSGIENIYLGGQALGMSRAEVRERIPEIVEFSGIGDAVNLPMSTYSSGMAARLRFAISTAAAPDVLMVDEALATGDAEFRARSTERIRQIREEAGTVFLVSHSNSSIRKTCNRVLWMDSGRLLMDGPTEEVLDAYDQSVRRAKGHQSAKNNPPAEPDVPGVDRWFGADRLMTSVFVSEEVFLPGVPGVLIANDAAPLPAITAISTLAPHGWPLILVKRGLLPEAVLKEISRLAAQQIVLLGDDSLVAGEVESQLSAALPDVPIDRCDESVPAAVVRRLGRHIDPPGHTVLVASEAQRRRLIPFGLRAARMRSPLIITSQDSLDDEARTVLTDLDPQRVILLGGADTVSTEVAEAIAEASGCEPEIVELTSPQEGLAEIAVAELHDTPDTVLITLNGVGGETLTALAAAASQNLPLLSVAKDEIPAVTGEALRTLAPRRAVVIGGPATFSPGLRAGVGHHVG